MNTSLLTPKCNIANKVKNTNLPRTKPLLPLFEVVSNAIHSIKEAVDAEVLDFKDAKINIKIIRYGAEEDLFSTFGDGLDRYSIDSFEVTDNGIGFTNDNLNFFAEADTDHKREIGGKGVGRFVCLKAFKSMSVKSIYYENGHNNYRSFSFVPTPQGFENYIEQENVSQERKTTISLVGFRPEYRDNKKYTPTDIVEISREIVTHFQLFFLNREAPKITIHNQNSVSVDLNLLFENEYIKGIQESSFFVAWNEFKVILTKSYKAQSHKLIFCAHNRAVKIEGLYNKIIDLGKFSVKEKEGEDGFYYQAFVIGALLDEHVDIERTSFNLGNDNDIEDDEDDNSTDASLAKIRREAIKTIEKLLADYLEKVRAEKIKKYMPVIDETMPQYKSVVHYKGDKVKLLSPNLSPEKLDIELYKIASDWKLEVKEKCIALLEEKKDVTTLSEYKEKYDQFLTEFNDVGKSELARYVVHRKAVIELLDELIGKTDEDTFTNEDIIHSIFFLIRTSSDEVPFNKQNLWLLDERLAYHSFLSSDKTFESIQQLDSKSTDRPDLLIFNDAIAFTEDESGPYNSFTIVEFKKPQRNNYIDNDPKHNPLDQVETYIEELLEGKVTNRRGRKIIVDTNTPFYVYIVCDITKSFEKILKKREFKPMPDGQGYFYFKSEYYSAYIEVIPFEKVVTNAKKRNRILFDKLGID